MDALDVNWAGRIAGWAWMVITITAATIIGVVVKTWRHHERLKTLEEHHAARSAQLSDISRKIDTNQHIVLGGIDNLRNEFRGDLRMIVTKLLDKVPGV